MTTHARSSAVRFVLATAAALALAASMSARQPQGPAAQPSAAQPARAWQDTVKIPAYDDGPPDPNPPFDLFRSGRFNYPYTLRTNLTDTRVDKTWRALWLENEYLKCLVLPDIGGHLYGCTDKRNGQQLFYANPSIKLAAIAYRGAWAAFGIEFNFPVSHNWMTVSPVDFAVTAESDGSASVWVGNIDRPYGMQWRVQLTLRPGRAVLEQHTSLYNRSDVRHRFYWWTNAGVEVWDDTRILYPTEFTASHGFTFVDTWPIDAAGHDVSIVGNHKYGPVSRFTHGSREPYMGVYHPRTRSGIVHYSPPVDLPAKKFWSWSSDADGLDWRRALSDNNSAYVEIQAGPFRNQETYGFLEPQQTLRFSEYWMPMLDLGGLSRASADAMLHLSRAPEGGGAVALDIALNTVRAMPNARVEVSEAGRRVLDERADLLPSATWRRQLRGQIAAATYTFRVSDAAGAVVLEHTEGVYDLAPRSEIRPGAQPPLQPPPAGRGTDGDAVLAGMQQELDGQLLVALATYQEALKRHPDSLELLRSTGRLLVALKQYDAAVPLLTRALARVSNDREAAYYLALAQGALGRAKASTLNFAIAQPYGTHRAAALFNLAAEASRAGRPHDAIALLGRAIASDSDAVRAGAMEVALLRSANRPADAKERLAHWRRLDPTNSMLRLEAGRLGAGDASLWAHLAADPERILEIAVDYMTFGLFTDALALLGAEYPSGPAVVSEPGMPRPEAYPLIAYYRGYCQKQVSLDGSADYASASRMPTTYVFPHRPMSMTVLSDAAAADPKDATARFLLGSLYLSGGMTGPAMKAWEEARALTPSIPTLHRNMGYTLLATGQVEKAIELFREGMTYDAANVGIYTGLDQALSRAGRPAAERADAILAYPDQKTLPASLVYTLAVALAEAGRFDEAERQFQGRFFPREEGGINVRQIWLEVRARRAAALAKGGDCGSAMGIVGGLASPVASLAFTKDGLEPILAQPTLRGLVDGVRAACGGVVSVQDADVPYTIGSWDADRFGNHRAVVRVSAPADAVFARIPWRRPDAKPEDRHLIVVDGASGGQILNVERLRISRESGDLVFEAPSAGDYFVYYLPNTGTGRSNYPTVTYPPPQPTADLAWLKRHGLDQGPAASWKPGTTPVAAVVEFQAIEPLHSFYPMQVAATAGEVAALLERQPSAPFLVFAEDRTRPIKMAADLPLRWVRRGAAAPFVGDAMRGEYYPFQVGVFAARQDLADVTVSFSGLRRKGGGAIAASGFSCLNLGGIDSAAKPFTRALAVPRGRIQPVWCGVQVPESAPAGDFTGTVTVSARGAAPVTVPMTIRVSSSIVPAHGDDEPWRLSRLRWLNSTLAVDDQLVKPYTPVTVSGRTVGVLGRQVTLNALGLPERIESRFAIEMTHLADTGRQVLSGPVSLVVQGAGGRPAPWKGTGVTFTKQAPGAAAWRASGEAGALTMNTTAQMDFDGNIEFAVAVRASSPTAVEDIRLEIPVAADVARYLMGLGFKGGRRPASYEWKWDVRNNQDSAWLGDVNAGLQFTLKDDTYVRPLNTNFYTLKPLVMPASWFNGGKGGCRLAEQDASTYLVSCYSGARTLSAGETLRYDFRLLLTPFKPIDTAAQFGTRYFHAFKPVDDVVQQGANVVNVHHANSINPYINYPFFRPDQLKAYIDRAHAQQLRVKIYYTVRELANRAPEVFALRSLGDEIFAPGPGGGYSWLQEHLGSNYIAAWFVPELKDAAIVNSGVSRWHNFYVEGLDWLARHVGIDGLYIDDVAFDRLTMKRVRKVLDRNRPDALIDLHSANQYNVRDGFASSANLYLEHFPYLNRLWFGEYFDYNSEPDYWLTEISGIPFGLMGEMLEGGGNPWRGLVFGMTGRLPWAGNPRPMWKAWDQIGIPGSRMVGFWVPANPVKTGRDDVLATTFVREGRTAIALASWAKEAVDVRPIVDWKALGLDPARVRIIAPGIEGFQEARTFGVDEAIPVQPGKGWLLVLQVS